MMKKKSCQHIDAAKEKEVNSKSICEECEKTGDTWVHLRTCVDCGVTLCCDSSPNQHASKHAKAYQHPVIRSAEAGESWLYCYPDKLFYS